MVTKQSMIPASVDSELSIVLPKVDQNRFDESCVAGKEEKEEIQFDIIRNPGSPVRGGLAGCSSYE